MHSRPTVTFFSYKRIQIVISITGISPPFRFEVIGFFTTLAKIPFYKNERYLQKILPFLATNKKELPNMDAPSSFIHFLASIYSLTSAINVSAHKICCLLSSLEAMKNSS